MASHDPPRERPASPMNLQLEVDAPTAIKIAEYFEKTGATDAANTMWHAIHHGTAYDRQLRETFGDILFDSREKHCARGTLLRSQFLLYLMSISFPTPKLVAAYFQNLRQLLQGRTKLREPGNVVFGVGTGRCGSTTLSAAFGGLPEACATHENPPHIFWEPLEEQVRFHLDRLRLLVDYFPLVFDAAHWWLKLHPRLFVEFPRSKMIGLVRETDTCVQSFLKFQGSGSGSMNNWAPADNGLWRTALWDPTYPKYPVPAGIVPDTDEAQAAKTMMITRYVTDYNQALRTFAAAQPQRVLLIRTEALNEPTTATRLQNFVGANVTMPARSLNVGNDREGSQRDFWF